MFDERRPPLQTILIPKDKQLRYQWDPTHKKWWFSAVDICALLCDSDYQKARNYWKWLKSKLYNELNELIYETTQLKLVAQDGKCRFTDVLDAEDVENCTYYRQGLIKTTRIVRVYDVGYATKDALLPEVPKLQMPEAA